MLRNIDFSSWQSVLFTLIGLALFTLISIGIRKAAAVAEAATWEWAAVAWVAVWAWESERAMISRLPVAVRSASEFPASRASKPQAAAPVEAPISASIQSRNARIFGRLRRDSWYTSQ